MFKKWFTNKDIANCDNKVEDKVEDKLDTELKKLPALAVRDLVAFPHVYIPMYVGRESSRKAIVEAMKGDSEVVIFLQKDAKMEDPNSKDHIYSVGAKCKIIKFDPVPGKSGQNVYRLIVNGKSFENCP